MKIFNKFIALRKQLSSRFRGVAYWLRRNQLIKALIGIFLLALSGAIAVTYFERNAGSNFHDIAQGLWWAMVTMTTVGYGDLVPSTAAGRMVGAIVMLSGVALVSIFTAAVSTMVITTRLKEDKGLSMIRVRNHICILGWNPFGEDIIRAIKEEAIRENRTVVLINMLNPDNAEQITQKFRDLQIKFVHGDFTDEATLMRASINHAFAAIILPDDSDPAKPRSDETTILATLTVKAIEPKVKVIAHILEAANEAHIRRANADQVVLSNRFSGFFLANHVVAPGIPETIEFLLDGRKGVRLARHKLPRPLIGKSFAEVATYFKRETNSILLGFIKEEPGFKLDDILSDDYSAVDAFIRNKLATTGKGLAKKSKIDIVLNPPADYLTSEREIAIVIEKAES